MNQTSMAQYPLRMTEQTKRDVEAYAAEHGVSVNAALNVLIRKGLQAEDRQAAGRGERGGTA